MVALALVLCLLTGFIAHATVTLMSGLVAADVARLINDQAYEYALDRIELIKSDISNLEDLPRTPIEGTDYSESVSFGSEEKEDQMVVKIYYKDETSPRCVHALDISEFTALDCPVGTIIAWPSMERPKTGGVWLPCDGRNIGGQFTQLRRLVGNKTPLLCGEGGGYFLRGVGGASGKLLEKQEDAMRPIKATFVTFVPQIIAHYSEPGTNNVWEWIRTPGGGYWNYIGYKRGAWNENWMRSINFFPTGVFSGVRHEASATGIDRQNGHWGTNWTKGMWNMRHTFSNKYKGYVGTESRPTNVAVMFMIKAL